MERHPLEKRTEQKEDLSELDELSDEEFDALKEDASLIWSGMN